MSNKWQKLTIYGEIELLNIMSANLMRLSNGIIEETDSHIHFIELQDFSNAEQQLENFKKLNEIQYTFEEQQKEDWHLAWKDNFTPINVKDKLIIIPDWDDTNYKQKSIKIKPGMAFGTGHHETTYLMLEKLIEKVNPNMSVLDLGSGSGVLAIVAKKLGGENVVAVEFDKDCEENFHENLVLNNLNDEIEVHFDDVLKWTDFNFDLILANINIGVIRNLIPNLTEVYNKEILLTGLLKENEKEITELILKHGFILLNIQEKGEWIIINISKTKEIS